MIKLKDIEKAASILKDEVIHTPLVYSPTFSEMTGAKIYLKLENLQKTGSFKLRGATHKMQLHRRAIGPAGVVAASAGNHAQGVALAARRAALPATIVMPEWASLSKQEATRGYGGEVVLYGESVGESIARAMELAEAGKTLIHPYDDEDIIAGQASIGLEILQDLPDADIICVPVGGGGLIAGIASAVLAIRPATSIIGVQAAACPAARMACEFGRPVPVEAKKSIADGIAVKQLGALTFPIIAAAVDDIVLVEEDQIAAAVLMLMERKKVLAEGAGAVPLAAALNRAFPMPRHSKVVLVISGGNVDSPLLGRIIRQGLFRNGRTMRFSVFLDDAPGALARILALVASQQANVLHIYHTRSGRRMPINVSCVELELETRGPEHIGEITQALTAAGYDVVDDLYDSLSLPRS